MDLLVEWYMMSSLSHLLNKERINYLWNKRRYLKKENAILILLLHRHFDNKLRDVSDYLLHGGNSLIARYTGQSPTPDDLNSGIPSVLKIRLKLFWLARNPPGWQYFWYSSPSMMSLITPTVLLRIFTRWKSCQMPSPNKTDNKQHDYNMYVKSLKVFNRFQIILNMRNNYRLMLYQ